MKDAKRFGEAICAAAGVRRANRRLGRPNVTPDRQESVEGRGDLWILNRRGEMQKLNAKLTHLIPDILQTNMRWCI